MISFKSKIILYTIERLTSIKHWFEKNQIVVDIEGVRLISGIMNTLYDYTIWRLPCPCGWNIPNIQTQWIRYFVIYFRIPHGTTSSNLIKYNRNGKNHYKVWNMEIEWLGEGMGVWENRVRMNGERIKEQAAKLRNCDREYMTEQMSKGRSCKNPYSKVHGANMGPTWVPSAPNGPHVGSMNLAIREMHDCIKSSLSVAFKLPDSKPEYFMYARPQ